ncbi:zinc finger protein 260-like [Hyposmocoma kahamanoa]|uniref:zinc finger protein 260-like n=1 Tax=Hyposmocoma kahamanoa TaxID=1477025 RepID=UPI000E6D739E|nr:zinc finger protein 260-like [Hyposmocoma kahamanoa]
MATAYLAQKLMTLKLDKVEVDNIRQIRNSVLKEKRKLAVSIKQIVNQQKCHKTCRLCLRPGDQKICGGLDDSQFIAKDIKYVTGIEVLVNDGKPQHICNTCMENLQTAVNLKKTAEITQWRLQKECEIVNEQEIEDLVNTNPPAHKKHHNSYFVEKVSQIVREWRCKECNNTFQNEAEFTGHVCLRSCNFMCEVCGSKLKTIGRLKRHRLTHHKGERPHKCRYCSFSAFTRYDIQIHERWHTGDRPFQCNICSCTFTCKSTLWKHRKTHEPPKFHCKLCPRSFRFKQVLRDHIANFHTKLMTHLCNYCDKAFATRRKMLKHERKVHKRPNLRSVIKKDPSLKNVA